MTTIQQNLLNPNNQPLVIGEFSIRQDEDGRYCLNDLHKAGGDLRKDRPGFFIENEKTQELIAAIEDENYDAGNPASCKKAVNIIRGRGKEQGTYVVKELVYSYAMWISAKFHLMVIRAYDSLVMEWMIGGKQTISPEQAGILYNIVHTRAGDNKNTIVQMWSRLKNHFKYSASYRELRAIHFEDAKHYLEVMDLKVKTEKNEPKPEAFNLNEHNIQGLAIHMIWVYKWWKEFGPAIRALSPRMAGDIHDNFIDGHSFATHFIDKPTRLAIDEKTKDYQWHASFKEKLGLDFSK
ncbi:KilA-N domain-containing protein [Acinetobacter johnsonii]|uniref:KilA-N domain-containing protein n=1 Tax=Acinetobacter johnsonii TaxID=40214 RepID=UPI002446FFFF|nr:KilA-N domain-containing protein [Acinetobacter johnsonii]MDH1800446.1 KilA-N domain-containing protein [Acinetobacter johnsonii]